MFVKQRERELLPSGNMVMQRGSQLTTHHRANTRMHTHNIRYQMHGRSFSPSNKETDDTSVETNG